MNPCPTPPVCEFGEYGTEAEYWGIEHQSAQFDETCSRCGEIIDIDEPATYCQSGDGGLYGTCGHRPLTAVELASSFAMCHQLDKRPEVDRINVVPCDGTMTWDAILFGPIDIVRREIRDSGADPDEIGREGAEFVRRLREDNG